MVRKEGQASFAMSLDEAYRRSAQALVILGATVTKEDAATGTIEARIPMSLTSWGENLAIQITGVDDDALVSVTSSSNWSTTLFDFGKNQQNVTRLLDWLRRSQDR